MLLKNGSKLKNRRTKQFARKFKSSTKKMVKPASWSRLSRRSSSACERRTSGSSKPFRRSKKFLQMVRFKANYFCTNLVGEVLESSAMERSRRIKRPSEKTTPSKQTIKTTLFKLTITEVTKVVNQYQKLRQNQLPTGLRRNKRRV